MTFFVRYSRTGRDEDLHTVGSSEGHATLELALHFLRVAASGMREGVVRVEDQDGARYASVAANGFST